MKIFQTFILAVVSVIISASAVQAQVTPGDPGNFITTWNTENPGPTSSTEIRIPTTGSGYSYDVYWEEVGNSSNNGSINGNSGDLTIDFLSAGIYRVEISGDFPRIHFNGGGDRRKILTVEQWGDIEWTSMEDAFRNATNLTIPATDAPDLSGVTSMAEMFWGASSLDSDIDHWVVDTIEDMSQMFQGASSFDQDLNSWDTGNVQDMSQMFQSASDFNGNIGDWDVSSVTDMSLMFRVASSFNRYIGNWNTSNVTEMDQMFDFALPFDQDISEKVVNGGTADEYVAWDVGKVETMYRMFANTDFDQNIDNWDVSSVENMQEMFSGANDFNQPLNSWNTESVTTMRQMFSGASSFNQDLNSWDVSIVINMRDMFNGAGDFNGNISNWDTQNVETMYRMFKNAGEFNSDISKKTVNGGTSDEYEAWDVSKVETMREMFMFAYDFNADIGGWDVSNVTTMRQMFNYASSFNHDLDSWDVSQVSDMRDMFANATVFDGDVTTWNTSIVEDMSSMFSRTDNFNQDISTKKINPGTTEEYVAWDVSNVEFLFEMFGYAESFNQDISGWDVGLVLNMNSMFYNAISFNQDLSGWDLSTVQYMTAMLDNSGLSTENYDNTLTGWAAQTVNSGVSLGASGLTYCDAEADRQILIDPPNNWTITGDALASGCVAPSSSDVFVISWKTDNPGTSGNDEISIPIEGTGYNFSVDWGDGNTTNWQDGDAVADLTHTYLTDGTYTIEIDGDFPRIYFNNSGDRRKIVSVIQWGTIEWSTMEYAFFGAENLEILADDTPDLSHLTSMKGMFRDADSMNQDISDWDTGNVEDMSELFMWTDIFNQPLNSWDTGNVTTMASMFEWATAFDQSLDSWDVISVKDMSSMFNEATEFNGTLNSWEPDSVTTMEEMFYKAESFNQPLDNWNTGSVVNMSRMFEDAENFNRSLNSWDVSNVEDMSDMFHTATAFDGNITEWNTESVMDMSGMFFFAVNFNQDLSEKTVNFGAPDEYRAWVLSSVTDMNSVFFNAEDFDHDISDWSTENVESMASMFRGASSFNQDIGPWDTGEVTSMTTMFLEATLFDQDLGEWDIADVTSFSGESGGMFGNTDLSTTNYDSLLIGWAAQTVQSGINFDATGLTYCEGADARQELIDAPNNWTFNGDALAGGCVLQQVVSASNSEVTATTPHTADGVDESTVTIVLRDEENDPISGFSDGDFLIEVTGSATASEVTETGTAGTYSFTVTDAIEEIVTVTVTADGTELDEQPTIDFEAPPQVVSASNSEVTATTPHTADGVDESTVKIVLRDEEDDPISGFSDGDFLIEVTGSATASEVTETGTAGTYSFTLTDAVEEIVTVTITADGTELDNEPTIDFEAPPQVVSASNSEVTATTPHTADGVDESTVTIVLRDEEDDPISGYTSTDFSNDLTGNAVASEITETGTPGTYSFTVTDATEEIVTITVTANSVELDDQPTIDFEAPVQVVDASASEVTATTPHVADGVDQSTVTVILKDEENDTVSGYTSADFSIALTGSATAGEITETGTAGTYSFTVSNTVVETVTVTVTAAGTELDDQPTIVFEAPEQIVNAINSEVTATSPHVADGLDESLVTVTLRDDSNDPVTGFTDADFLIELSGSATASEVSETETTGTYQFTVTDVIAETVIVTITTGAAELEDQPKILFEAKEIVIDPEESEVTATTPHIANGEDESTVTIFLQDVDGNPVLGYINDDFKISLKGSGETSEVEESEKPGFYSFTITDSVEETVAVAVIVNEVELKDQPEILFEAPKVVVSPVFSEVSATSPHVADGEDASIVTVTIRDENKMPVTGLLPEDFSLDIKANAEASEVKETEKDGVYSFSVLSKEAGTVIISVKAHGVILDQQAEIVFEAPEQIVDAFNSEVTTTTPHLADGKDASTVTITLIDENNESISGRAVDEFFVQVSGNGKAEIIKETKPGIYQFSVTNDTAEIVTVTITVSGVKLNDQPKIQFEKAPDPVPDPPVIVALEGDENSVQITWQSQNTEYIDRFLIYRGNSISELSQIGEVSSGVFQFRDSNPNAGTVFYAVSAVNRDEIEGDLSDPVTFFNSAIVAENTQWKLVSNPLGSAIPNDENTTLFSFSNKYEQSSELMPANGYWIKSKTFDPEVLPVTGAGLVHSTIELQKGWNLIGSLSAPISVDNIMDESGILTSAPVYGFTSDIYQAVEILEPNEGYWLFAEEDGSIELNVEAESEEAGNQIVAKKSEQATENSKNWIEFSDKNQVQKIWIAENSLSHEEELQYLRPPVAPGKNLDVRTDENMNMINNSSHRIEIHSDRYPVTVRIYGEDINPEYVWRFVLKKGNEVRSVDLLPGQPFVISKEYDLIEVIKTSMDEVVTENKLLPNYPNPFNPSTTIQYQLRDRVQVNIEIYDVAGRRVQVLANELQVPGNHQVQFNAGHFSSGMYFVRFIAGGKPQIQKITLIK